MARTNYSTYSVIKRKIIDMFRDYESGEKKLPPEAQLAEILDVSISTLREVLVVLALEGYITKKHGVGNFIHPSTLDIGNRSVFFADNLKSNGYTVEIQLLKQEREIPDEEITVSLRMPRDEEMLSSTTVHLANQEVAIYTQVYIPTHLLVKDDSVINVHEYERLNEMVWRHCRRNLAHSLNDYVPVGLSQDMADIFKLPVSTPVITNRQVFYDTYDEPVMYCLNYFHPQKYRVTTLQNWALGQTT